MDIKKVLLISLIAIAIVASASVVSAGWFDFGNDDIKTHEFNFSNEVIFNISDELTNKTGVEKVRLGDGVSFKSPENNKGEYAYVTFEGRIGGGVDDLEIKQNDAYIEEIERNTTSQGYDAYIFEWTEGGMYEVYIDLKNITIDEPDGSGGQYQYFSGAFQTLDEAHIFIETFKINEDAIEEGV